MGSPVTTVTLSNAKASGLKVDALVIGVTKGPSGVALAPGAEDVDKTVQLVKDNGGSVIRDAEDTPYGRLAAVADPTGAGFNLSSLDQY